MGFWELWELILRKVGEYFESCEKALIMGYNVFIIDNGYGER